MSGLTSSEGLSLFAGLAGALMEGERAAVAELLGTLDVAELRTIVVAGAALCGKMLDAEAEVSGADLDAPAVEMFRLAAIASRVL